MKVEILNKNPLNNKQTSIIEITGKSDEVKAAEQAIKKIPKIQTLYEGDARLLIQKAIDDNNLAAAIMFNGNLVYSKKKIISNLDVLIRKRKVNDLSNYFYDFLYQVCGSIAHYCKDGWIEKYPRSEDLKKFFDKNEYGQRVLDYLPDWYTDAKAIAQAVEDRFYPLRARARAAKLLAAK